VKTPPVLIEILGALKIICHPASAFIVKVSGKRFDSFLPVK
jgi:hypothetical protein